MIRRVRSNNSPSSGGSGDGGVSGVDDGENGSGRNIMKSNGVVPGSPSALSTSYQKLSPLPPQPSSSQNASASLADHETKLTWFVVRAAAVASLGGILFGYDLGVVSGALPQVREAFNLKESQQESVVSFLYLGAGLGAAVGGYLCDSHGRRWSILLTDVIFILGAGSLYIAQNLTMLLIGRFIMGFGVSLSGCADVAYLTEISPKYWRGAIVSRNEACISFGFLVAYSMGYLINLIDPQDGWRIMFGCSAIMAIIQLIGMLTLPESPVWMTLHPQGVNEEQRREKVIRAIQQIYEFSTIEQATSFYENEFQVIIASDNILDHHGHGHSSTNGDDPTTTSSVNTNEIVEETTYNTMAIATTTDGNTIGGVDMDDPNDRKKLTATTPGSTVQILKQYHRQAMIAAFLSIVQQFCGHTNVLNFAPEIFSSAGLGANSSLASTMLLGGVKFVVTILVIWKIDNIGRVTLLLGGMGLIAFALLSMSIAFYDAQNIHAALAVTGAVCMAIGYAASFGPLTWLLTSEMFPSRIRGRALGVSTVLTYLCASLVSYTFLSVQSKYNSLAIPFMIYLVITTASILFAIVAIPDTGTQSPSEIHSTIKEMVFWRTIRNLSDQIQQICFPCRTNRSAATTTTTATWSPVPGEVTKNDQGGEIDLPSMT